DAIVKVAADAFEELEERAASQVQRIEEDTRAIRDDVRKSVAEGTTDFEKFAQKRLGELEDALRARLEVFRRELIDETHRVRDASAEQLNETRSLVTAETRRLEEQAEGTRGEMRRVAGEEMAAFDKLARKHMADVERHVAKLLEAETSTAEGLRDFERQMEGRRAEIETILDDRTTALTQHVQQAEAAAVRRIRELGERAADNAQALDTKLGEATSERSKELDTFA